MEPRTQDEVYCFGAFRLHAGSGVLEHHGKRVLLAPKTIDTLLVLIRHAGEVMDKKSLTDHVWPETFVVASGLTRNISLLRKTLRDLDPESEYVETIPKRGYRFVAAVERVRPDAEPPPPPDPATPPDPPPAPVQKHFRRGFFGPISTPAFLVILGTGLWYGGVRPHYGSGELPPDDYLIARHLWQQMNPQQVRKSVEAMARTVERYPNSALAHAGLAQALVADVEFGGRDHARKLLDAQRASRRALELNPKLGEAHIAEGMTSLAGDWNWNRAEAEFRRAIALDGSASAWSRYACFLLRAGRIPEASRAIQKAADRDPVSPLIGSQRARIEYSAGRFGNAAASAEAVLDREPDFVMARYYLALSLVYLGNYERAAAELQKTRLNPELIAMELVWLQVRAGHPEVGRAVLHSLPSPRGLVLAASVGDTARAVKDIEVLIERRSTDVMNLPSDPRLEAIRTDPRYPELLRKIGL